MSFIANKSQSSIAIQETVSKESPAIKEVTLKREMGIFGSFSIGFADVGADIYVALGLVLFYALGVAPISIGVAAIGYMFTALSYAELASAIPKAGGASIFAREAFNDFWSFIAGWGLLLDYTIDIALFGWFTIGYLGGLMGNLAATGVPLVGHLSVLNSLNTAAPHNYTFQAIAVIILALALLALNYIGIRESSNFNIALSLLSLVNETTLIIFGLLIVWKLPTFTANITQLGTGVSWQNFGWGITLAMVSFIGLESISQAAEETKRPDKTIPRATFALIVVVILISIFYSVLAVGLPTITPQIIGTTYQNDPVAGVARGLALGLSPSNPLVWFLPIWASLMGFVLILVSTNTGVIGSSRVTFSMARYKIMPSWFNKVHPKYRVPYRTVIVFTLASIAFVLFVWFMGTFQISSEDPTIILGDLYNYGALVAFMLVNLSVIMLRNKRPELFRPYKIPFELKLNFRGKPFVLPVIPLLGFLVCFFVWFLVLNLHQVGKIVGTLWFIVGIAGYLYYRKRMGLDWKAPIPSTEVTHPDVAHLLHPEIADELKKKYDAMADRPAAVPGNLPVAYGNILVAVSRPEAVESMLQVACDMLAPGGRMRIINVVEVPPQLPADSDGKNPATSQLLLRASEFAGGKGVAAASEMIYARSIPEAIVDAAKKYGSDLVVMGSSQRTATEKFFFGNVVDNVLRTAPCDVVVFSYTSEMKPISYEKILVPTSGYRHALRALGIGIWLEKQFGGRITSIYVGQSPDDKAAGGILDHARQYADSYGVNNDIVFRSGDPVENILSVAKEGCYSLIIVGSTERPYYYKTLLGSTADEIVRRAPCNVLVVKMKEQ